MPDGAPQSLFVDFMYAVVVGAALPRIDKATLSIKNFEFWGIVFLLAVFLEDFYLYHRVVLPYLAGFPSARQLILSISIVLIWYFTFISFPSNPKWFLSCFLFFFSLKLLGGFLLGAVRYPWGTDLLFLIPICTCIVLLYAGLDSQKSLRALVPAWILTVILWWLFVPTAKESAPGKVQNAVGFLVAY